MGKGVTMAGITDYDAPRTLANEPAAESLDLLQERRNAGPEEDLAEPEFELPAYDIIDEELTAPVIPVRADEFRCGRCFLVLHRSMHAGTRNGADTCRDCA